MDLSTFDKRTKSIASQPFEIDFVDENGRRRSYIPDYLVDFHDGRRPVLVDVKDERFLRTTRAATVRKFLAGRAFSHANGFVFRFITQRTLLRPIVTNAVFLRPYQHRDVNPSSVDELVRCATLPGILTLRELLASLAKQADMEQQQFWLVVLWHAIANFRLGVDLTRPLRMSSTIESADRADDNPGTLFWTGQRPW